jgi:hypothetical protein
LNVEKEHLHKLVQSIFDVHEEDGSALGCEDCGCQLDCIAELVAGGADLRALLPAVEAHLQCCKDCREEFEALIAIIRAQSSGAVTNA